MLLEPIHSEKFHSWAESSGLGWKVQISDGKFRSRVENSGLGWKVPVSGGRFQAMLLGNVHVRSRCRQVVVLWHAVPGPEFPGIILAV
jgi:hypothetical protein